MYQTSTANPSTLFTNCVNQDNLYYDYNSGCNGAPQTQYLSGTQISDNINDTFSLTDIADIINNDLGQHNHGRQPLNYQPPQYLEARTQNYSTNVISNGDQTQNVQNNLYDFDNYKRHISFDMDNRAYQVPSQNDGVPDRSFEPYVEIVEQPARCALRFRYKCEGRSAGSLPGLNSSSSNKTYPTIRIVNYTGRAVVVISCVTKDSPFLSHPHNIVGKEGCKKGICTLVINNESNMVKSFSSIGIQCVKRKDIEESLTMRESIKVDPFRNGFAHKSCASSIDLNVVRLCFQVFIEGSTPNKCDVPLMPVVSDPIHDKKAMSDLVITKLSHCSAPATGGREVILLCDRISKDDIQIHFYQEDDDKIIWETYLSPTDVHKNVAICFKTPKYYDENIPQPVMARIQLKRPSDDQVSEPRWFQFLPCESDEDIISRKRQKVEWINQYALNNIQAPTQPVHHHRSSYEQQNREHQINPEPINLQPQTSPPVHYIEEQQKSHQTATAIDNPTRSPDVSKPPTAQLLPQQHHFHHHHHQHHHQQNVAMIDEPQNMVVMGELIDNEGKVMRLVDRPNPVSSQSRLHEETANQMLLQNKPPLASSLDRIDTAELMHDMTFNSNLDFNFGPNLSMHMNAADRIQLDIQQRQTHQDEPSTSGRNNRQPNCNGNNNK